MRTALYVFGCVILLVAGQVLIKHGLNLKGGFHLSYESFWSELGKVLRSVHIWVGGLLTVSSGFLWLDVLSRKELSSVYPFISLTYVISLAVAALVFREHISLLRWSGVAVICVGVWMVSRS
ncbi:MAG: hypothetical protein V2A71_04625 [Candidatus Eisenbacteria bacterium]